MRPVLVVLMALLVACGGNTSPKASGPARMAIVRGNFQIAVAGTATLAQPVTGQLYRAPNGQVAFRLLDAFLPAPAYAQTVVKGAPIVGAVVCWADVPGHPRLIPFSVCTNTNDSGLVAFNLRPDTLAGSAQGQVHWDSAGTPIVTDSVQATIQAGAPAKWGWKGWPQTVTAGDSIHLAAYFNSVQDAYGNTIPEATLTVATKLRFQWVPPVQDGNGDWNCAPATTPADSGWVFLAPDSAAVWPTFNNSPGAGNACVWLWIGSSTPNTVARFTVKARP